MNALPIRGWRRVKEGLTTFSKHDAGRVDFIPGRDFDRAGEISCQVGAKCSFVIFDEFLLTCGGVGGTEQFIDFDGRALSLYRNDIQKPEIKSLAPTFINRFTLNDRGPIFRVQCLESGGEINCVLK
jgi:hypothetical protein